MRLRQISPPAACSIDLALIGGVLVGRRVQCGAQGPHSEGSECGGASLGRLMVT